MQAKTPEEYLAIIDKAEAEQLEAEAAEAAAEAAAEETPAEEAAPSERPSSSVLPLARRHCPYLYGCGSIGK